MGRRRHMEEKEGISGVCTHRSFSIPVRSGGGGAFEIWPRSVARFCSFCFLTLFPRAPSRLWPAAPSCVSSAIRSSASAGYPKPAKAALQAAARQFLPEKCPLEHALQTPAPHNNAPQPSRITTNCSFYPSRSRRAPQQQCLSRTSGLGRPQARRMPWTSLAAAQHSSTRRTQRDRGVP
jgi:hypothetical protein